MKEDLTKQAEKDNMDKLEAEKLEEILVYTIETGSYNKWNTTDKDAAYKVWQALTEAFFELEELGSRYEPPHFKWKKPMQVKMTGEKVKVWKDYESAQRAHNAFEALSNKPKQD